MEKQIEGWVIVNKGFILDWTFEFLRTNAIKHWLNVWSEPKTWQTYKRQGMKCVKATQTVKILET